MKANLGELDALRDLAHRLDEAGHGERKPLVEQVGKLLNCSEQTVYRKLKKLVGWTSGRKRRKDSGKMTVSEDTAKAVAHLMHKSTRKNGKRTMPMTVACSALRESGFDEAKVSTTTISRAMRRYRCHPDMLKQGKPYVNMRSLHPNHVWQVDPSICVLFYLPKGGMAVMEEGKFYKNKPGNMKKVEKERIWRYVITDHYSGTIYVRYVQSAGETAQGLVDVLLDAMSVRGLNDPMNGAPFLLGLDPGSANTAFLFKHLCERLGIELLVHMPGNPRAKGQVECANNIVETQFESRLGFMNVQSVEELQQKADQWRQHYNATAIHSRTSKTRNDVWLTIAEDQLRLIPALELCRELVTTKPKEATVDSNLSITHAIKGFGRNTYDLRQLPGLVPKMKVDVVVNPYRAPAVDVIIHDPSLPEDPVWTVEPKDMDEAGFWKDAPVYGQEYQSKPDTLADKTVKEIDEKAGPDPKHILAPEGVDVMADVKPAPDYLPKRGRDIGVDASKRELAPYTVVEAARMLKQRLGDEWNAEAYAFLQQRYPDGVPVMELDDIAARLGKPEVAAAPLKLVVNEG
tara:strand:- start:968 stop:2686 length:1719 start_codon:yes stop_codon:yes gene_type:complete